MKPFDKKFGADFFASLPTTPGIYRVYNDKEELIYVGKAKNLRRRLGQYRNAKRRKKHYKMRKIVAEAAVIKYELFPTDHEACLAELQVIQQQRPKWNREGAFYFLYPMIGISYDSRLLTLLYSTEPEKVGKEILAPLSLHGAYRSRHLSGNAFFALVELLAFVGHQNPAKKIGKYSYLYSFRQVDSHWQTHLDKFFRGDSDDLLETLILQLVESASARKNSKHIQELIKDLIRFYRHEARVIARVSKALKISYPIQQRERDVHLLKYRMHREELAKKAFRPQSI
ncbi:MAG: nucleotide excision repair endonuclease [Bdellovibrionota bacterium]